MHRTLLGLLIVGGMSGTALAQVPSFKDYCQADPVSQRVADATAVLVPLSQLQAGTTPGTYRLTTYNYTYTLGQFGQIPICPYDAYYNQQRLLQGRTGFLVDERTIVTAAHTPTPASPVGAQTFHPANYAIVFGWRWEVDGAQPTTTPGAHCKLGFDPQAIPYDKVYFVDNSGRYPIFNTRDNPYNPSDYMSFTLDRPVVGAKPLPLRRSGSPMLGDPLIVPGYPDTLPLKIGYGGRIQRVGAQGLGVGESPDRAGSSGSPVFNLRAEVVETVYAKGNGGFPYLHDPIGNCLYFVDSLDALGRRENTVNNGTIAPLVAHIARPPNELAVTPLNLVRHQVAGTTVSNAVSYFDVSLPAAASAPVTYKVSTTNLAAYAEIVDNMPGLKVTPESASYTATPGAPPQRFRVEASSQANACESIEAEVRISPQTPGALASVIPHRFEVVRGDFEMTPDTDWTVTALAAPYPTRQLTLHNPSPVPVSLTLTSSRPWLRVGSATSASINLAPAGLMGDSASVQLSIAANADVDVPPGTTATGTVTIAATTSTGCLERSSDDVAVTFTNGVQYFSLDDVAGNGIPRPTAGQTYGAPLVFGFNLSAFAGLPVGDVDLRIDFQVDAFGLSADEADDQLRITLSSPRPASTGQRDPLLLWEGNTGTTAHFLGVSAPGTATQLFLDDATAPPLGGDLLNEINGENMGGIWTLSLQSRSSDYIFPLRATLKMTRQP